MKYVAYYRVSTDAQGQSGLGLLAQKNAVEKLAGTSSILSEFTEIESGSKNNRAELDLAVKFSLDNDATLIIAKLDRLSRNTLFIAQLQHSKVKFVCCDMPNANNLTISLLAAVAENELANISDRTSKALQVLKSKGVKLGTPENLTSLARDNSIISRKNKATNNQNNKRANTLINSLSGNTLAYISSVLNAGGFETSTGKKFSPTQVMRVKKLYEWTP
jgi:DNA invertase Pin-like site-specific DNA recombinase